MPDSVPTRRSSVLIVSGDYLGMAVPLRRPRGLVNLVGLAAEYRRADQARRGGFADALRQDAAETLDALRGMGTKVLIASGDRPEALEEIARTTGATAIGHLRPADKLALIGDRKSTRLNSSH